MDKIIAKRERLAYAKVCVEIEASKEIPKCIKVDLGDGYHAIVTVECLWLPLKCCNCKIFGHTDKTCPNKPVVVAKIWRPKQIIEINDDKKQHENINGTKQRWKVGSIERFAILNKDEATGVAQVTSVQGDMAKDKDSDSVPLLVEDKGNNSLVVGQSRTDFSSVQNSAAQITSIQGDMAKDKDSDSVPLLVEDKGNNSLVAGQSRTDFSSVQNSTDDEGEMSRKRPILPISKLVKQPRLASLGVPDVVPVLRHKPRMQTTGEESFSG
ncbi:hypothetical protein PTKIN_Ptkin12aG0142700 [Pterospermum kingtungense]